MATEEILDRSLQFCTFSSIFSLLWEEIATALRLLSSYLQPFLLRSGKVMIRGLFEDKHPIVSPLLQIVTQQPFMLLQVPDKSASDL